MATNMMLSNEKINLKIYSKKADEKKIQLNMNDFEVYTLEGPWFITVVHHTFY